MPGGRAGQRAAAAEPERQPGEDEIIVSGDDEEDSAEQESPFAEARFNLYAALRDDLVAKGIPRHEIAFIHDARGDEGKGRLFAAVRSGQIRVLIGSTGKMGVGTNVQKRLIAMHHIDAPWRPADVEQRDGRILRQGNDNSEIEIFRYITRGTLDAYRWQVLNTKANFIAQLRAGARGVRVAEDIDSPLPEAAMIKAAATGDPRIMEHAELTKETQLLEAGLRAHERSRAAARNSYAETVQRIAQLRERIADAEQDAAEIQDISGSKFTLTIAFAESDKTVTFTQRRPAGEALVRRLNAEAAAASLSARRSTSHELGTLSGFTMTARIDRVSVRGPEFSVGLRGRRSYSRGEYFPLTADIDPIGLVQRFASLLKQIPQVAQAAAQDLAQLEADLPRLERLAAPTPFARQDRLTEAKRRLEQLGVELGAEETRRQRAASQTDAPRSAPVSQAGDRANGIAQDQPGQAQGGVRFSLTPAGAASAEPRSTAAIWDALRETAEAILPPEITVRVVDAIDDAVDGGARLSLAGRRAGTARLDTLASAERLEASGRPPQAIFAATGWLRGPDGKWRWEIDDSGARILNLGKYTRPPSRSLVQRLLRRHPVRTGDLHSVNNIPLPRILHHPALFAAYPFLRRMRVDLAYVKGLPDRLTSGALRFRQTAHATIYRPIRVLAGSETQILDVLLHEIQHYIQRREGFAQGSDLPRPQRGAGGGSGRPPLYDPTLGAWVNAAFPASTSVVTDTALEMDAETLLRAYRLADSADPGIASGARAEIAELEARIERDMRVRAGDYGRSFGEWEAGLVARRRGMTAHERRAAFPLAGMPKGLHVSRWQTRDYQAAFDELMRRAMINLAVRERWADGQDIGADVVVVRSDEHWLIYAQGREPRTVFAEVHDAYRDAASATIALSLRFAALAYGEQRTVMDAIRADLRRRNMNPQPSFPLDETLFAFWARYDPAEVAEDPRLHREALTRRLRNEYGEATELVLHGDMASWEETAHLGVTDPYAVYVKLPPSPNVLPDAERARIEARVAQLEAEHIALHAQRAPTAEAARQRLRRLEQIWQERLGQEHMLKVDDELRRGVYRVPDEVIAGIIPEIQRDIDDTGGVDFDLWLTAQRDRAIAKRGIAGDARLALQAEGEAIGRFDPDHLLIEIARHALDPEAVLRHEAIHALKAMELFTPAECSTLEQAAHKQGWIETSSVRAFYAARHADLAPAALEALLVEEAIAERFSAWCKGARRS